MDSTKPTSAGPATPGFGVTRDLQQLKTHSTASVSELREFLTQMRGRSPQEVLGLIAGSHLLRNVAVATVGALVILVAGSAIPWWMNRLSASSPAAAKPEAKPPAAAPAPAKAKPAEPPAAEPPVAAGPAAPTADAKPSAADAAKAIQVMGLGDTKVADPKTNPLDKKLDDLLDKLE